MKAFMDKDFLLTTETAKYLYHQHAAKMPIIDYHCHINPKEIAEDRTYDNLFQVWLAGDHYKWRAIRSNGVDEKYITGNATEREKFQKWAETLPKAIGNPLYHWTHLELKAYFDYNGILNAHTAEAVWALGKEKLAEKHMSVRGIIEQSNVKLLCTTDDPVDSLEYHKQIKEDPTCKVKVLPAFRPDPVVNIDKEGYLAYIQKLAGVVGRELTTFDTVLEALEERIQFFHEMGCLTADHGIDYVPFQVVTKEQVEAIWAKRMEGGTLTLEEVEVYKTALLIFFAKQYHKRNWVLQIHYGVIRNNNTRRFGELGPDTGFDSIGTKSNIAYMAQLFDALEKDNSLPKTIVYSINPADNEGIGTLIGCFQSPEAKGKLQHGSAWWFNDTKTGMQKQMTDLANLSLLGNFIGMLTDSRSFLSYTRHEYFRRILCELIGGWVENGEYPDDREALGSIVRDICYNNTKQYFGFDIEEEC